MQINFNQKNDGVDFLIDENFTCSFKNFTLIENKKLFNANLESEINIEPKKITFNFKNENYDIVTLSFKKIKKLKENTFYVEVGEKIIQIYSEKTSLISDKNLIISVNGESSITFEEQAETFKTQSFQAFSVSSDYIFEKILPSFSITFYKTFNNNIFSDRFDSYKDVQIISTVNAENEAQNNVLVYAKVISHAVDNLSAGVINQNYLLAFYFDFYNNPGNKRVAPLTKVKNDTEGSIYYSELLFDEANYQNFFDGLRECRVEVKKFVYQNAINIYV